MRRLTVGDRLVSAAVGAFFGGLIGFVLSWLLGVYSNTLGIVGIPVDFKRLVGFCAMGFGVVGLLFGPFVGTLIGSVISGIFRFEHASLSQETDIPTWLVIAILVCIVAGAWWIAI